MLQRMAGKWIVFVGDSTHRQIYEAASRIVGRQRFNITMVRPQLNGFFIRDHDNQKDTDMIHEWAPKTFCKSCTHWDHRKAPRPILFSHRFLRGLDLHKLGHNAVDWRHRYHYTEWLLRSEVHPMLMLFDSDRFDVHPLARDSFGQRRGPDAVIFHACSWDLPHINRSHFYYGYRPTAECAPPVKAGKIFLYQRLSNGTAFKGDVMAPVLGSPCVQTGENLTDDAIYSGFEVKLRTAVRMIRERYAGRLILRSCHAGTQDGATTRGKFRAQPQFESLVRMDAIVRQVAHDECVDLLDVFALVRARSRTNGLVAARASDVWG